MDRDEFLKCWHESGKQDLAAQITPETINDEHRTLDIIFYTGADIDRYSWSEGSYILRFDPKGADFALLNQRAPVIDNHWMFDQCDQFGCVEKAWADKQICKASLRFKRSTDLTGPRPELDGLWQDIKDKIVCKFSMGVEILESIDQRNKDGQLEIRTAMKWRPFEISIAPIPADFGTDTLSAGGSHSRPQQPGMVQVAAGIRIRETEILRLR
jgi:hypothetical protein